MEKLQETLQIPSCLRSSAQRDFLVKKLEELEYFQTLKLSPKLLDQIPSVLHFEDIHEHTVVLRDCKPIFYQKSKRK